MPSTTASHEIWLVSYPGDEGVVLCREELDGWQELSEAERQRAERFRFERDSRRWVFWRSRTKRILARYLGIDSREITFETGPQGKPKLAQGNLRFNISHSGDRMAVALSHVSEVGVDIERVDALFPSMGVAERYFHKDETAALKCAPPYERQPLFFRIWTGKEALMKATGLGMHLDANSFAVIPLRRSGQEEVLLGKDRWDVWHHALPHYSLSLAGQAVREVAVREYSES